MKQLKRAAILIFLKESYFFFRNLYGLGVHPFKTVTTIFQKPDWSQTILIFGLPGYLWILFLVFFLPVFWFFRTNYDLRIILVLLFYSLTLILFVVGCYLVFWLAQYFFRCKFKQRN